MRTKRTKNIMLIITYTVFLILVILNFNSIVEYGRKVLGLFSSFFIGIAIAFILNNPCKSIETFLESKFNFKKRSVLRGISVTITYIIFLIIIVLLIWFVIPQLFESIQGLVSNLGIYFNNFQSLINNVTAFLEIDETQKPRL